MCLCVFLYMCVYVCVEEGVLTLHCHYQNCDRKKFRDNNPAFLFSLFELETVYKGGSEYIITFIKLRSFGFGDESKSSDSFSPKSTFGLCCNPFTASSFGLCQSTTKLNHYQWRRRVQSATDQLQALNGHLAVHSANRQQQQVCKPNISRKKTVLNKN